MREAPTTTDRLNEAESRFGPPGEFTLPGVKRAIMAFHGWKIAAPADWEAALRSAGALAIAIYLTTGLTYVLHWECVLKTGQRASGVARLRSDAELAECLLGDPGGDDLNNEISRDAWNQASTEWPVLRLRQGSGSPQRGSR